MNQFQRYPQGYLSNSTGLEIRTEGYYRDRFDAMGLCPRGLNRDALPLRFAAIACGVTRAIVGSKPVKFQRNVESVNQSTVDVTSHTAWFDCAPLRG